MLKIAYSHLCSLEEPVDQVEWYGSRLFRLYEVLADHRLDCLGRFDDVVVRHLVFIKTKQIEPQVRRVQAKG